MAEDLNDESFAARRPRVVLGVSGGIAAYKAVEVCRRLVDAGVHVIPVLTDDATRFVGELTFSALGSEPAQRSLWNESSPIPHTRLGQSADLVVVAPATAHTLARYAAGLSDDLLTATLLATRAPVLVCPAMHTEMWEHPSVQDNLATLERRGVRIVPPATGRLAGGDSGEGRLAEPATIVERVLAILAEQGSADPSGREGIDDLTGLQRGGERRRHQRAPRPGPVHHEPLVGQARSRTGGSGGAPRGRGDARHRIPARPPSRRRGPSTPRRRRHGRGHGAGHGGDADAADIVVMAAAVADFRPKVSAASKLSKEDGIPEIVLEPTPDILAGLAARRRPGQVLVGFAAETHDAVERGRRKLERKGVDLLVVNDVSAPGVGFDHDTNAVVVLGVGGERREIALTTKDAVANGVLDSVIAHLEQKRSST